MRTAIAEPTKLGPSDVRAIALSGVVVLDTLGVVGLVGGESLVWLALLSLLFVVPYALLMAELGSAFPEQGGPYAWVRLAFGRPAGALCALLYWIATPIWLGGTLAIVAVSVFEAFLADLGGARWAFALAFIWLAVGRRVGLHDPDDCQCAVRRRAAALSRPRAAAPRHDAAGVVRGPAEALRGGGHRPTRRVPGARRVVLADRAPRGAGVRQGSLT